MADLRRQRLEAEASDLQRRLVLNGYKLGEVFDPDTIPEEHKGWIARLWYIGFAMHNPALPEVP